MLWNVRVGLWRNGVRIGFGRDIRGSRLCGLLRCRLLHSRGSVTAWKRHDWGDRRLCIRWWSYRGLWGGMVEEAKAVEGAVELLLEAGFGSIHQLDGTAGVGGAAVGKSGAGGRGEIGGFRVQSILVIDDGGFEVGHADETPAGRGHGVDQGGFGGRGGVVFGR